MVGSLPELSIFSRLIGTKLCLVTTLQAAALKAQFRALLFAHPRHNHIV